VCSTVGGLRPSPHNPHRPRRMTRGALAARLAMQTLRSVTQHVVEEWMLGYPAVAEFTVRLPLPRGSGC
jgi:hypothetical protein